MADSTKRMKEEEKNLMEMMTGRKVEMQSIGLARDLPPQASRPQPRRRILQLLQRLQRSRLPPTPNLLGHRNHQHVRRKDHVRIEIAPSIIAPPKRIVADNYFDPPDLMDNH
jgi:hypothetical protein